MGLFFLNLWGWIIAHWRLVLIVAASVVLFIIIAVTWSRCSSDRRARLEAQERIEAVKAIEEQDRKKMIEILVNSDVREKMIDANVSAGREAVLEAVNVSRTENSGKTNEELAAELNKRAQE